MKFMMIFALLSTAAFAQDELAKAKELTTSHLDKRISILQEGKACVAGATSRDALKACHSQMKEKRKGLKSEMKSARDQWKSERKANKK